VARGIPVSNRDPLTLTAERPTSTGDRPPALAIHPGALGDVLQSVPALRALRRGGPLAFSGQPRIGRLLHSVELVQTVLPFDGLGLSTLFTEEPAPAALVARLGGFRRVISWFGSADEIYARRLRGIVPRCVIAPPVPAVDDPRPVWRHLLDTIGATAVGVTAPLDLSCASRDEAGSTLARLGASASRPLLFVHPGAGGRWKLWPVHVLARIIERFVDLTGAQPLVHQGPADREIVERLAAEMKHPALTLIDPDLPLVAAVLARAAVYLGVDSGVSQLAAAVGAPAVVLLPAATRERWAPWSGTATAMTPDDGLDPVPAVVAALRERMLSAGEPSPRARGRALPRRPA
jgi:ADP-heptose:LPS heptosyltransferase